MSLILSGYYSILLASLCGVFNWKFLPRYFRLLVYQCILAYGIETAGGNTDLLYRGSNQWIYNVYILAETWLLGLASFYILEAYRKTIIALLVVCSFVWIFYILRDGISSFANMYAILQAVAIIMVYAAILVTSVRSETTFIKSPMVLLSLSLILFYAGTLPVIGLLHYLSSISKEDTSALYSVTNFLCIFRYGLLSAAFILCRGQQRRLKSQQIVHYDQ